MHRIPGALALVVCTAPVSADLTLEYDPVIPSLRLLGSDTGTPEFLSPGSREVWILEGVPDDSQSLEGDSWLGAGVAETFPDPFLGSGWGVKENGSISVSFVWLGEVGETTIVGTGVPFVIEDHDPAAETFFRDADGMRLLPMFGVGYSPITLRVVPAPGALALAPFMIASRRRRE
jgi:hypothetical protein